ncbi:MAG: FumA C-terminus/TtdB family hydratase beta subunit [Candidatus Omnitrophota bacterium]|nr:FumA C-terminus/TtdB family hydratase beta subunit [Candidatus Omnitrophota bacterium]
MKKINIPLKDREIAELKIGDEVLLNGYVYTARDQTHVRLLKDIKKNNLPFDLRGQAIYYAGPTPAPFGKVIGSCGPTTSGRMDAFTPALLKAGVKGMIGKGRRSEEVRQAIKRYKAVYFLTIAGAGAYLSKKILEAKPVLYKDLGTEAVYRLRIKDFPAIVGIDSKGRSLYK